MCVTILTAVAIFNYVIKTKDDLSAITRNAETTYLLLLKDVTVTRDFFENETINPIFFKAGKSKTLEKHYALCRDIKSSLEHLNILQERSNYDLTGKIIKLKKEFNDYKDLTNSITRQILTRGFKDYGVEGEMRKHAHDLENYNNEIGLINILQLRRHEKDFIIRQEDQYVSKHKVLTASIKNTVLANNAISSKKRIEIISTLDGYSEKFITLTGLEKKIGLKNSDGMKSQIDNSVDRIEEAFSFLISDAAIKEKEGLATIKLIFFITFFIFIVGSIYGARYISTRVSSSITNLKDMITEFVKSDFTKRTVLPINDSEFEVDILATNVSIMEQHIVNQMSALKQTNKELETLFYKASYDIKTPLMEVKNLTMIATKKINDAESLKYFALINQSWQNLTTIVDELGMVNDIKNEEITTEKINFEEILKSVYNEHRSLPLFDNILFSLDITLKEDFYSSTILIKTIFRHLIDNSIKYSTKRLRQSFLKISIEGQSNNMLKITVSDNGIGIQKEHEDKIFDMFFKGTDRSTGTGLGLYIVQNSLQKINGAVSVESDQVNGTTFTILLPNKVNKRNIMERIIQKKLANEGTNNVVLNYI
ncbi:MAG: HAMP domain-containing sensor histidine kinase [Bacteroidia bacterium]